MKTKRNSPRKSDTLTAYARSRGLQKPQTSVELKKVGIDPAKPFDFAQADQLRQGNKHLARQKPQPDDEVLADTATFAQAQRHREIFKARQAELDFKLAAGELVPVQVVQDQWYRGIRKIRDGLLNLPDRTAGLVAAVTKESQAKVHAIVAKEVHQVLEELSRLTLKGKG
jgi:hypothetical protein